MSSSSDEETLHKVKSLSQLKISDKKPKSNKKMETSSSDDEEKTPVKKAKSSKSDEPAKKTPSKFISKNPENEFAVFDTETTGFRKPIGIIQFAAIVYDKLTFRELFRYDTKIKPINKIEAGAVRVHGLDENKLKDEPPLKNVINDIFDILNGRIWMGYNIEGYDIGVVTAEFKTLDKPMPVPSGVIDVLHLVQRKFGNRAENCKLETLSKYFNVKGKSHNAIDDCIMTFEVLKNICTANILTSEHSNLFPQIEPVTKNKKIIPSTSSSAPVRIL